MISALATVLLTGCATSSGSNDSAPTVLVTTSIWADVVENVLCGQTVAVEVIIPPGGDPHAFEPSLADRERMDNAALVVANGLSLEERLDDTISASAERGTQVFRFSDHIDDDARLDNADLHDHGDNHDHGDDEDHGDENHGGHSDDPHIWFDPTLVASALPALAEDLIDHVGVDRATTTSCAQDYRRTLEILDGDVQAIVSTVPEDRRKLVTSHDSLAYFAHRYGFEVIGTIIPAASTLAETNPAQLEELAELIEDAGVPAIFGESLESSDDADALARRVGTIEVVILDTGSLGPEAGADSYVDLLRTTAELISKALG